MSVSPYTLIMKDHFVRFVLLGFMFVKTVHLRRDSRRNLLRDLRPNQNLYEQNIIFHGYDAFGRSFESTSNNSIILLQHCIITDNVTIITHGWKEESIRSIWARKMIDNFSSARGGCIFFMDYEYYGNESYIKLYSHFKPISEILTHKLIQLTQLGFDPANFFLFGFSFGAHLMLESAYQFGPRRIGRIDCCDPAGPLFPEFLKPASHARDSAMFVQCIHTSGDKGTTGRYCAVNINMGKCGQSQPGSTSRPYLSHGLCPVIYSNAFNVDFSLVPLSTINEYYNVYCIARKHTPDVRQLPDSTMGFRFNVSFPMGEYFALTKESAPYNVE